jgi:hypothetical protein
MGALFASRAVGLQPRSVDICPHATTTLDVKTLTVALSNEPCEKTPPKRGLAHEQDYQEAGRVMSGCTQDRCLSARCQTLEPNKNVLEMRTRPESKRGGVPEALIDVGGNTQFSV